MSENPAGAVYIHFPFCRRRCGYCHFTTLPYKAQAAAEYLNLLVQEIDLACPVKPVIKTLYFGGGSPSLLDRQGFERIRHALGTRSDWSALQEWTVECNPEDVDGEQLDGLSRLGVNRISIGCQSFAEEDLRRLGRRHTAAAAAEAVEIAGEAGFENINIDLMIGLRSQTLRSLDETLGVVARLAPAHVSCYILEGRPADRADGEQDVDMYHHVRQALVSMGYRHYEISNFARPGFECRHNLHYWRNQPYLGLGISASGFIDNRDYRNTRSLRRYRGYLANRRLPRIYQKRLKIAERRVAVGLRLLEGVTMPEQVVYRTGYRSLLDQGILLEFAGRTAVAPRHLLMLHDILHYLEL